MSRVEKRLLVFTISPLVVLLIGLIMTWSILGPQTIAGLKALLSVKMLLFMILFAVAGLVFGQPGLKAMSEYMPYSDQLPAADPEYRRITLVLAIMMIIGTPLCALVFMAFPDLSRESFAKTALLLIITGLGFSVMFGTIFVCASIIRIRSRRDS